MGRRVSLLLGIVTGLITLLGVMLPASASASTPAVSAPHAVSVSAPAIPASTCYVTPKSGVSAVFVHTQHSVSSPRIGQINSGQTATASCTATSGGTYTACGGTSGWWVGGVRWNGSVGYVALLCVNWYT
jgi:hypothetical protein